MRIVYGITGEGLGHTMRARVVIPHLVARGHDVLIAASSRAARSFEASGHAVVPIDGLSIRYRDGALQRLETLIENVRRIPSVLDRNVRRGMAQVAAFDPDVLLSDFDSFAYACGRLLDRPVVSFDHQHVLTRFAHPDAVMRRVSYDFFLSRALVERKLPRCARYLVSSFYFPTKKDEATEVFGPVVRAAIERARPTTGEHVLVYQTASGDGALAATLAAMRDVRFRAYGLGARASTEHVAYCAFDEACFVDDLASARAVITNGGFMTLSEALVLGKPVLSCPIRHQGEQELNAAWLEHLGLGLRCTRLDPHAVRELLRYAPRARVRSGTADALGAIDRAVENVH